MSSIEDQLYQSAHRLYQFMANLRRRKHYQFYDLNGKPLEVNIPYRYFELDHQLKQTEKLALQKGLKDHEIALIRFRASQDVSAESEKKSARLKSIKLFFQDRINRLGVIIVAILILTTIAGYYLKYVNQGLTLFDSLKGLFLDFYANIGTDLASTALTILFITRIYDRRDKRRQVKSLVRQLRVSDPGLNYSALLELMEDGYIVDGSLEFAKFRDVILLVKHAQIGYAKLHGADFYGATMENIHWFASDFREANFRQAKLKGSSFLNSKLVGATFTSADLRGVDFRGANLLWVEFQEREGTTTYKSENGEMIQDLTYFEATFDETTTLPDGQKWFDGIDLGYYTDPYHEGGYWQGEIHKNWEKIHKAPDPLF